MSLANHMYVNLIPDGDGKTKQVFMIVGIVVGIAILLSAGLIICFVRRRRNSGSKLRRRESKGTKETSIHVQQVKN